MGNAAPDVEISALAYSSDERRSGGALLLRARASAPTVTTSPPDAVERGAVALVCERPLGLGRAGGDRRTTCGPRWARRGRALLRRPDRASSTSSASPAPTARRRRRSSSAHLLEAGRASRPGCSAPSSRVVGGREERGRAHHARGDRPPGDLPRDARRAATAPARWRSPRTRSSWGAPTGIHFACRGLHQPDPGPPRLPRDDGGLLRRQAAAVRGRGGRGGRERRRRRTAAGSRARCRRAHVRDRARGRLPRAPTSSFDLIGLALHAARRRTGELELDIAAARPVQRAERARRRSPRSHALGVPLDDDRGGAAALRARAGPLRAGRRGPGLRRAGGLRAHARRARERAARRARPVTRGAAARGVRRRRRPRPRQAPADGRRGAPRWPTACS